MGKGQGCLFCWAKLLQMIDWLLGNHLENFRSANINKEKNCFKFCWIYEIDERISGKSQGCVVYPFLKCCLLAWGTNRREQETSGASHCIARTGYGAGESWNGRTADIPGSWAHHWKYTRGQVRRGSTDRGGKEWTPEKDASGMIHELCKFSDMSSVIHRVFPCPFSGCEKGLVWSSRAIRFSWWANSF